MNETAKALLSAAKCRPMLVRGALSWQQLLALRRLMKEVPRDHWVLGDRSRHSWREYQLQPDELLSIASIAPAISRFTELADRYVAWINWFHAKQWIGRHRDADGDAQLIIPLVVPALANGGHLWVGTKKSLVPVQERDLLIFNAAGLPHGTTPCRDPNTQRITLNIRLWHQHESHVV